MAWYAAAMPSNRELFDTYLALLRQVVVARGGDPAGVDQQYLWPDGTADVPRAAASLSPLLTGGQGAPPWTQGAAPSGVVAVPPGLVPPPRR